MTAPHTRQRTPVGGASAERTVERRVEDHDTSGCCSFGGWVYVELSTIDTVRPCDVHRPEQHERWVKGSFLPSPWWWFEEMAA